MTDPLPSEKGILCNGLPVRDNDHIIVVALLCVLYVTIIHLYIYFKGTVLIVAAV